MLPPLFPKERRSRDAAPRAGSLAMTQTTKQVSFRAIYEARLLRAPKGATGRQARTFPSWHGLFATCRNPGCQQRRAGHGCGRTCT